MSARTSSSKRVKVSILLVIALIIVAAIVLLIIHVLLPRYDININGAKNVSVNSQNGIKYVSASVDQNCNVSLVNNVLNCSSARITGSINSNKTVQATVSGDVEANDTKSTQINFTSKQISIKPVVIRAKPYGNEITNTYTIKVKNTSSGKEVVDYALKVNTIFSSKDLALINKTPSNDEITKALKTISTIDGTCTVTEANDTNNQLNKKGGYIAAVYFSDNRADLENKSNSYIPYKDICDEGASAGGEVEVYTNSKDAKSRADYISGFTGTLGDGDDTVYGTSVVRISNAMTATQIADLKAKLDDALTK
jgi:hypothetical protein